MSFPGLPLPTDSLYKFLALAGLTIVIVSFAVPLGLLLSNQNEMTTLSVEIAGVRADIASAQEALTILPTSPNDQARTRELLDVSGKLRRRLAELQPKLDAIHRLNRRANDLAWLALGGPVVGLILSGVGFWLWWTRLQQHVDDAQVRGKPSNRPIRSPKTRR
jgi:hypothetical protein